MSNQLEPQHQQLSNGNNNAIAYHFNPTATRNVYDWYQTNTHVIINIMIKNLKEADVKVKLIDETLDVTCDLADGSIFKLHFNLFKPIYVQDSNWSVTPSKLEIQLKKTDRKRWQSLELIPEKSKQRNSHQNSLHHNNIQHHSPQTQTQPSTQQQQLQTQIETLPDSELEQAQQQQQNEIEPGEESKVKIETEDPEVQCHMELQHSPELQSEHKVEPEKPSSPDQTQPQSQVSSHETHQTQITVQQQQAQQQQQQFAFTNNKSNPEELEFLTNSVELSSSLIELDFVLSV